MLVGFNKKTKSNPTCKRFYYSDDKLFEKSLDVWEPPEELNEEQNSSSTNERKKPAVVLVVGSGWLGHRSFIYTFTSWWNSSGPRNIAKLGYTCICIRHRSAFPVLPEDKLSIIAGCIAFFTFMVSFGNIRATLLMAMITLIVFLLLEIFRQGSAQFDDMPKDVVEGLVWVQANKDMFPNIICKRSLPTQSKSSNPKQLALVFGGYSSGGHVAATVLQNPQLFTAKGLPPPDELFISTVFISGLFAVKPFTAKHANHVRDHCPSPGGSFNKNHTTITKEPHSPPRWLTDLCMSLIWGNENVPTIPSPLHVAQKTPSNIPHLFVGCKNELFGIPLLDLFFCSSQFVQTLQSLDILAKFVEIDSNHWSVLNSNALSHVLKHELQLVSSSLTTTAASS